MRQKHYNISRMLIWAWENQRSFPHPPSLCEPVCIYVPVCHTRVWFWNMHVWYVTICMSASWICVPTCSCMPEGIGFSALSLRIWYWTGARLMASKPQNPLVSGSHSAGVTDACPAVPDFCAGAGIRIEVLMLVSDLPRHLSKPIAFLVPRNCVIYEQLAYKIILLTQFSINW